MDTSSIKTAAEALAMIEKLKLFIKEDSKKISAIIPFEIYECPRDGIRIVTPSEVVDEFYLGGLCGQIDNNFSDKPRSLIEWRWRAEDREWTKSSKTLAIVPSTVPYTATVRIVPEFLIKTAIIRSVNSAETLISKLNDYVSTFDKLANGLVIEDIQPYEIFSYECAGPRPRMLVPVYASGSSDQEYILTGRNDDVKYAYTDMRKTADGWLEFANEHSWKKTGTKFGVVNKE